MIRHPSQIATPANDEKYFCNTFFPLLFSTVIKLELPFVPTHTQPVFPWIEYFVSSKCAYSELQMSFLISFTNGSSEIDVLYNELLIYAGDSFRE